MDQRLVRGSSTTLAAVRQRGSGSTNGYYDMRPLGGRCVMTLESSG